MEPGSSASDLVIETTIAEVRTGLDKGWFTIAEYIEAALERIGRMDQQGPTLNAVIELNPDAMEIAEQLDQEARSGRIRGPMHGIPVLVKDIYATADSMLTTAGSIALEDNRVTKDAFMVETLRNAGAVILGKTNLTEFSNFRGGVPNGWSSRGGQTVNPYVLTHTAWGSSTGSAVAVAASYVPVAIGSETDGSIICPAAACGVVGFKPTVGLVSRRGSLGISFIQDSPGPMGRTVEDVAYALSAMVGYDPQDMAFGRFADYFPAARFETRSVPDAGVQDYTRALDPDGLRGARIGVCRSMFGFDPVVDAHVEIALDAMREAGAEVIDDIYMEAAGIVRDGVSEGNMLVMEFAWSFQNFLDTCMAGGPITSLADVINFNYEHPEQTLAYGGQEGLEVALNAGSIDDPWFEELVATNVRTARDEGIDLTMDEFGLDALVAPSAGIPGSIAENLFPGSSSQVPSMAGYPSLTLPIGYTNGLPAGLQIFGRAFSENTILKLAYSLEQALQLRQAPQYLEAVPWDTDVTPSGDDVPDAETGL
jgi:amidase